MTHLSPLTPLSAVQANEKVAGTWFAQVLEPIATTMGFELVHVEWVGGRERVVRVYLDQPGGIRLEDCARMSPILSNALDAAENQAQTGGEGLDPEFAKLLRDPYTLEVSSPGLERPLAKPEHFVKYVGQRICVRVFEPLSSDSKQKTFHGTIERLISRDDGSPVIVVLQDIDGYRTHEIPLSAIKRANLVYEGQP